jgi:hypothetical protein
LGCWRFSSIPPNLKHAALFLQCCFCCMWFPIAILSLRRICLFIKFLLFFLVPLCCVIFFSYVTWQYYCSVSLITRFHFKLLFSRFFLSLFSWKSLYFVLFSILLFSRQFFHFNFHFFVLKSQISLFIRVLIFFFTVHIFLYYA